MDTKQIKAALDAVHVALNATTDAEVKAKRYTSLKRLEFAANAIELARGHVVSAEESIAKAEQKKVERAAAKKPAAAKK